MVNNHSIRSRRGMRARRPASRQAISAIRIPTNAQHHCGKVVTAATGSQTPIKNTVVIAQSDAERINRTEAQLRSLADMGALGGNMELTTTTSFQ
jgi:hypothetical protein